MLLSHQQVHSQNKVIVMGAIRGLEDAVEAAVLSASSCVGPGRIGFPGVTR
jgi:hypothetical protein